jgi:hypothetical protein
MLELVDPDLEWTYRDCRDRQEALQVAGIRP